MEEIMRIKQTRDHNPVSSNAWYHWNKLLANAVTEWRKTNTLTRVK